MKNKEKTNKPTLENNGNCTDVRCNIHGSLKSRGRIFQGYVIKKFPKRVVIEFERLIKIQKYERFIKKRTRIHARLPDCRKDEVIIGDYISVQECRPLSKIVHFVYVRKVNSGEKK